MTNDVEQWLRTELHGRARGTRTSPSALEEIHARAARTPRPPRSWRRPAVALLAAVILLVVGVWAVTDGSEEPPPPIPPAQPLPDRPPVVEGTVVGAVGWMCGSDGTGDCVDGPAELDLDNPATPRILADPLDAQSVVEVLRDGRQLTSNRGVSYSVVDPESGRRVPLGDEYPTSVDVLPDGRVVTFAGPSEDDEDDETAELRIVDSAGTTARALPERFQPYAVTAGTA